jgi:hypothetical protein
MTTPSRTSLRVEALEDRSVPAGNTIAQFEGVVVSPTDPDRLTISLGADFALAGPNTILGLHLRAADGSPLDPAAVRVRTGSGGLLAPRFANPDLAGEIGSLALVDLPPGTFVLEVGGDRGTVGGYRLDVFLAGDADGDRAVTAEDGRLIQSAYGAPGGGKAYLSAADANFDGRIDAFDYSTWRSNLGDRTTVAPLALTAALSPSPIPQADGSLLVTSPNVRVVGATRPGAAVSVDADGDGAFDDGSAVADAAGVYSIPVALARGGNTLRVRASDSFGQHPTSDVRVTLRVVLLAVGNSDGGVTLRAPDGSVYAADFRPLDGGGVRYTGLVQVALGDLSRDGVADLFVAATSPAGADGLDSSKAGLVFVYDGAALAAGNATPLLLRTFVPFATSDSQEVSTGALPATTPYTNGLNVAVADVDGDGVADLIAGTRGGSLGVGLREFGRVAVVSGANANQIGNTVKPFGNGYDRGVEVAAGNLDGKGECELAVTRGGPVAETNPNKDLPLKVYQLKDYSLLSGGGVWTELDLAGTGPLSPLRPFPGVERDGRVAFVDGDGDGKDELVFAALDRTDPANPQLRIVVYSIDTTTGRATVKSTGSGTVPSGAYLVGDGAVDFDIAGVDIDGDGRSELALILETTGADAVSYLDPLTGELLSGGFPVAISTGGVFLAAG